MSLVARTLEAAGIATVIMGCAKDIVEHAGVPRFYFSDFPLGHSAGLPDDISSQERTLAGALHLLAAADAPRTTHVSPQRWPHNAEWEADFMNVERLSAERIHQLKTEFAEQKRTAARIKGKTQ